LLYPVLEMTDWKDDALSLPSGSAPLLTETVVECGFLLGWLELRQKQGVTDADLLGVERFDHYRDKLRQSGAAGNVGGSLADLRPNLLDAVLRLLQIQKRMKALRLLQRVNVTALQVLDLSLVLQKQSMTSTTMKFCTSWNLYL
jgi:hypothetical protein